LLEIVRGLGWPAQPILADRRYGADTHCALLVSIEGRPHLLDPGYLILRPVPLDSRREVVIPTDFNRVVLGPREGGERIDLFTEQEGARTYRLTFKTAPVDRGEFLRAWDASFDWDMMRYPLLSRVAGGRQVYLQGRKLQHRSIESVERRELAWDDLPERIAREFGIAREVIDRALRLLERKGERSGKAPTP
ncbi:MAG: arylamine N-acetyltransferase, partial [Planctomycetes bacterium]|nr:arylamine N-acetyltransferase [Planctomycetota bacterium]